jgi:hypothetical protein
VTIAAATFQNETKSSLTINLYDFSALGASGTITLFDVTRLDRGDFT